MSKMWDGRFSKQEDERVNDFNSSIAFDSRMFRQDIAGSIAHATMLGDTGVIEREDAQKLIAELKQIERELAQGTLEFDSAAEDVHMFIEAELTKRLGDVGKRLHTARSRNDQVALDVKLYLRDIAPDIKRLICQFAETLIRLAQENLHTIMPGYTHLQRAQPITFAHHLMAYVQMLLRDAERLNDWYRRADSMPLGSGALAGTTYPIDRMQVCQLLGFARPTENSLDGVSSRDDCVELAFALSLLMTHLSRLAEEVILWCSWEFRFVELDDAFATGSSIMPQKKNPDVAELVRGKAARAIGNLTTLLVMLKGTPLAYNKDMQEDKQAVFDAADTAIACLQTMIPMMQTIKVQAENMRAAAAEGFINATDCADYLTKKGLPFRDAYKATGRLVAECIRRGCTLETLPMQAYREVCALFEQDVFDAINLETCVRERNTPGGPAPEEVSRQIQSSLKHLAEIQACAPDVSVSP